MTELQKDPITRSDFLGFGFMGAVIGAILTIPPVAFVLGPVIKTDLLGQSDISKGWQEVGPVSEVKTGEPKDFTIQFPIEQAYGSENAQKQFPEDPRSDKQFTLKNAVWASWRTEYKPSGEQGTVHRPSFLDQKSEGFSKSEIQEIEKNLTVLSNSCAHLGCPVRWVITEGEGEFLCPCHGGIYNINGKYVAGPPPRGMYHYKTWEVRENGKLYVKHGYDVGGKKGYAQPYVV